MSVTSLLFLNTEPPDHILIEIDGRTVVFPPRYPLDEGHGSRWDKCFAYNLRLPRHHYQFGFPIYTRAQKSYNERNEPEWMAEALESARIRVEYLKELVNVCGEEPLYIRLHADHVMTDSDLEDIAEIDLDRLDFREGYEPDEFVLETNRFYRFVRR